MVVEVKGYRREDDEAGHDGPRLGPEINNCWPLGRCAEPTENYRDDLDFGVKVVRTLDVLIVRARAMRPAFST